METVWFCLVAFMLAMYVVFDGFDLGAGALHLIAARNERERQTVLRSIGPVWDGNEVWLLAAGGTLYFAFPTLYASSFSGFYLPLMMVLWLLILRGVAIEFRNQIQSAVWQPFWDVVFSGSSILLTIFFGAALGNVVRGVPLNDEARFFLPLWTDFQLGPEPGILDWYTVLVGLAAFSALTLHGAAWVALKTEEALQERALRIARVSWAAAVVLTVLVTVTTFQIQPYVPQRLLDAPWGVIFPLIALAGLAGAWRFRKQGDHLRAFFSTSAYIVGMLTSVAFGLYPYVLPSNLDLAQSLHIQNAAAGPYGLKVGLFWFFPALVLVSAYFAYVYRNFAGKVRLDEGGY